VSQPPIPLLDLGPQHEALMGQLEAALGELLRSQRFILGPNVGALEEEAARALGAPFAVGCASGSDALLLALRALDVDATQAVVTTPFSFFATAGAPARLGARVDFVDVEPDTLNMDPARLEAYLAGCRRDAQGALREPREGKRVTALVTVDLYGRPCDYAALEALAQAYGLRLIEDAAQAWGARRDGRACGTFGDAATFSFFPTKSLGGCGDGGLVTTADEALATRVRSLRVHGSATRRFHHEELGWNSRLDELQAALLRVKLPHVASWNAARRERAARYDEALGDLAGVRPLAPPGLGVESAHHLYVVRAARREGLRERLAAAGISTGVYYPLPLHLQPCFAYLGYQPGDLPVAEAAAAEVLALPLWPELDPDQQGRVIEAVAGFAGAAS
jgi:dTDP-4-amino-4,6-dideoxygalactose transaminase